MDEAKLPFDARLVVEKGDYAGKVLKLGGGTAMIGRSSKCELSLKGSSGVSRRHCKVQLIADRYVVIDLESRNGTVVNGETVARKFLHDGDLLEIGDEHVRFIATPRPGAAARGAPAPSDSDIEDQPTALASPLLKAGGPPPHPQAQPQPIKPTPPSNASATTPKRGESATQRRTVPQPKQPPKGERSAQSAAPARSASPPSPPPMEDATRTASFMFDASALVPPKSRSIRDELSDEGPLGLTREDPSGPPPPPLDETSAPYVLQGPQRTSGSAVMKILLVMVLLVIALVGVAAWDLMMGPRRSIAFLRQRAPAAAEFLEAKVPRISSPADDPSDPAVADAGTAGTATAETAMDAGAVVAAVDAGTASDAGDIAADIVDIVDIVDAGSVAATVADAGVQETITVVASAGGRIDSVRVKVGAAVKKGQTIATLEGAGGLRKKLEALREEERDFEQAVKKGNKSARKDLEQVRQDIAELSRRVRPTPLVSDADGTVVEVLVKDGAAIKAGAPLVTLKPSL